MRTHGNHPFQDFQASVAASPFGIFGRCNIIIVVVSFQCNLILADETARQLLCVCVLLSSSSAKKILRRALVVWSSAAGSLDGGVEDDVGISLWTVTQST